MECYQSPDYGGATSCSRGKGEGLKGLRGSMGVGSIVYFTIMLVYIHSQNMYEKKINLLFQYLLT